MITYLLFPTQALGIQCRHERLLTRICMGAGAGTPGVVGNGRPSERFAPWSLGRCCGYLHNENKQNKTCSSSRLCQRARVPYGEKYLPRKSEIWILFFQLTWFDSFPVFETYTWCFKSRARGVPSKVFQKLGTAIISITAIISMLPSQCLTVFINLRQSPCPL